MDIDEYIERHSEPERPELAKIYRDTNVFALNGRMVSGHVQGRLLSMLSHMVRPQRILEIGTFTGYSALCLAEGLVPHGVLHTIEVDDELEDWIRKNLNSSPYGKQIVLHIGPALQVLPTLHDEFDLVFVDADKREYTAYYEAVLPMVRQGGYILADNTLWGGKILQTAQHGDKQTVALQQFNDMLATDERVEKVILPLRDGLTLIRKK